ncbi:MAG: DUF4198 domain-containing protein [Firmicutes bacterium]|nr:DUF4198 domain-containing protein [Bacillota bacterium]MCL5038339.1 DUF4198 domain-containing protein [Bacillota bacterium]
MEEGTLANQPLLWLEGTQSHYHTGFAAEIKVVFGPRMRPDRLLEPEEVEVYLHDPRGGKSPLSLRKKEKNWLVFSFLPQEEGALTVIGERRGEGRQYLAKTIISVGHDIVLAPTPAGLPLELQPLSSLEVHQGDSFTLTLLGGGQPQPEGEVLATYSFNLEETFPYKRKTDAAGRATFPLEKMGNWLFVAQASGFLTTYTLLRVR